MGNVKKKNSNKLKKRDVSKKKKGRKVSYVHVFVLICLISTILLLFVKPYFYKTVYHSSREPEIEFKKEGQLSFFEKQTDRIIKTIDIEIAEDDYEQQLGLMYRYSMSDKIGMLFIMDSEIIQSFWMKDTYVSLDIIYLSSDFEIVKIHEYAEPLSERPIPSIKKSKYVLEVLGGFCDKLNIKEGDQVKYERI